MFPFSPAEENIILQFAITTNWHKIIDEVLFENLIDIGNRSPAHSDDPTHVVALKVDQELRSPSQHYVATCCEIMRDDLVRSPFYISQVEANEKQFLLVV